MSDVRPSATSPIGLTPRLHRLVSGGHLRYWIITSWALALATELPLLEVVAWYGVTMALGLARTFAEAHARRIGSVESARFVLAVATLSCAAWAAAPFMAFQHGAGFGAMLAVGLLCAGYTLVFTQMRAAPREALIVSTPYTIVFGVMVVDLWGAPGFWTMLGLAPMLGLALLIKVVITQIRDEEIARVTARQASLIEELERARDAAEAANQAKSNFLGVISHELRTPMNGVLGAAQLLTAGPLAPQERQLVTIIQQSGESLLSLLNDILDVTKIEAGRMEMAMSEIALTDLCRKVVGPFQAHAEAKGLDFTLWCDPAAPEIIRTDPLRLAQIIQNFISNAIKFTTSGGVHLSIALEGASTLDRATLILSVSDEGMGISEADLSRLFEPFTQVDDSSTRRFAGTGLGLSIAKRMAELLGGSVSVRSTLGEGSVFSVALEVEVLEWRQDAEGAAQGDRLDVASEARPLRVLVVEDHPINRMILEAFLSPLGHGVTTATNGREAVEAAEAQSFDLVIMDVNMPVMDGLAATRAIRSGDGPNRETPIAMLSASARGEDHDLGFTAGADAYLDKPVDFQALGAVLACASGGRTALQSLVAGEPSSDDDRILLFKAS